jgi:hypothetical protein
MTSGPGNLMIQKVTVTLFLTMCHVKAFASEVVSLLQASSFFSALCMDITKEKSPTVTIHHA